MLKVNSVAVPTPCLLMMPFIILALGVVMVSKATSLYQLSFAVKVTVTGVAAPVLSLRATEVPLFAPSRVSPLPPY